FVRRFPTLRALARASRAEVLKAWQGMGYYARARRLHRAARHLVDARGGQWPRTAEDLERLPGVGPYIARAVAAQAFGEPVVALEANGLRVAARWTGERGRIDRPEVRTRLAATLAGEMIGQPPGRFAEAVMELGETVCTPRAPRCPACPVGRYCRLRTEGLDPGRIPARRPRSRRPTHRGSIVALIRQGRYLLQRRPMDGLLGGLWEFPGGHRKGRERPEATARRELREETGLLAGPLQHLGSIRHSYSHFSVELDLFRGPPKPLDVPTPPGRRWLTLSEARRLPLPRATEKAFQRLEDRASPGSGSRPGRGHASPPGATGVPARRSPRRRTPS
ncbi:A/G-specific adenine glycosylase, partial [mine drainage metagenome]